MECCYCNSNPGNRPNSIVWNGFLDLDTGQGVCFKCRALHYDQKNRTELAGLFTEFPVIVPAEMTKWSFAL
ncbi:MULTISPECIES: hypothetical protein [Flavobacteriaceae]|uniref:hypothetical protein n=1 Tax=Flavobacteriaceae TaxID=49546 RepID=UPI00149101C2|nr:MULTISPECIES: hypothetical protein [Allomuricauda]MDC6367227.1 hypothetical protein [Muricauda sp. AC10]